MAAFLTGGNLGAPAVVNAYAALGANASPSRSGSIAEKTGAGPDHAEPPCSPYLESAGPRRLRHGIR
jgi:hypothetical protein